MPRRDDIESILLIGSGPIVIGQACEFDYSGTQGAKALREEGYRVILVNSNPATIMTDPEFSDRTYVEPLTPEILEAIIEREKPDAVLPTLGGQTALNLALALSSRGVLEKHGVELIGAKVEAIRKAEEKRRRDKDDDDADENDAPSPPRQARAATESLAARKEQRKAEKKIAKQAQRERRAGRGATDSAQRYAQLSAAKPARQKANRRSHADHARIAERTATDPVTSDRCGALVSALVLADDPELTLARFGWQQQ